MTTTSSCDSCGMPIESGRYCGYCTDDSGTLQAALDKIRVGALADSAGTIHRQET